MSSSAGMGTAESGHLMSNWSPASSSVLLVDISHNRPATVRTATVSCDDVRTLKFTLIVQRMPNRGRCSGTCLCAYQHDHSLSAILPEVQGQALDPILRRPDRLIGAVAMNRRQH